MHAAARRTLPLLAYARLGLGRRRQHARPGTAAGPRLVSCAATTSRYCPSVTGADFRWASAAGFLPSVRPRPAAGPAVRPRDGAASAQDRRAAPCRPLSCRRRRASRPCPSLVPFRRAPGRPQTMAADRPLQAIQAMRAPDLSQSQGPQCQPFALMVASSVTRSSIRACSERISSRS